MKVSFLKRLRLLGKTFKHELRLYQLILRDSRTPTVAKALLGLAIGYALLPFDLIPDFIPILGHLDDVIIVPGLIWLALKLIPPEIVVEARRAVAVSLLQEPRRMVIAEEEKTGRAKRQV